MLSIYSKDTYPQDDLDAIIAATIGYEEKRLKKWQKFGTSDSDYIYIIVKGKVDLRRTSDNLGMFTVRQQCIFGLSSLFYNSSHMYGLARTETVIRAIPKKEFTHLINTKKLWPQLSKLLAWYVCLLNKRDDLLVARNAYSIIREFLFEIHDLVVQHNRDVNVYDYIQEYTNLARSTIVKILSDLKKGKYIVVERGRLLSIETLPEKY